ncbi:MAG: CRISPR-associated endonuclease Cas1, partial [Acidimicrobiia bacterium]|nr:CRISPR-associated endonuclease Cas1 [Acidimicrobiia bacterium]
MSRACNSLGGSWPEARTVAGCRLQMVTDAAGPLERRLINDQIDGVDTRLHALGSARDGDAVLRGPRPWKPAGFKAMGVHVNGDEESMAFVRRSRRPPRDPVNALLSFVYGILLTEVGPAGLEMIGLDQSWVSPPSAPRSTVAVLDLLEELRPSVADRFAVAAIRRRQVSAEDFETRAGHAVFLTDEGRKKVLALYDAHRESEVIQSSGEVR